MTGTAPRRTRNPLLIYPNPAQAEVWLHLPPNGNNPLDVVITNLQGQEVLRRSALPADRIVMIDLRILPPGIYAVRASGADVGVVSYIPLVVLR